ncbi:hypothetical protein QYM36_016946, partial [Artemia franciscana]
MPENPTESLRQTGFSSLGRVHVKLPNTLNDGASAIPKRKTKVDSLKKLNSKTERVFQSNITEVIGELRARRRRSVVLTRRRTTEWEFLPEAISEQEDSKARTEKAEEKDVAKHCQKHHDCQMTARKRKIEEVPLQPLPIIETPFHKIGMDLVAPLERSKTGLKWILVINDYATRYPEGITRRSTHSQQIADELIKFFSRVGIHSKILTENGSNLNSQAMPRLYVAVVLNPPRTIVYHPDTDGLVERPSGTIVQMLRKFVRGEPKKWEQTTLSDRPGKTYILMHEIDTGSNPPGWKKPYRVPAVKRNLVETEVAKMLPEEIMKPPESDYALPIVYHALPQANGTVRC